MSENKTLTILDLLKSKPMEWSVAQVSSETGFTTNEVHYIIKALVDLGKLIPTRKAGNAQLYCYKDYENQFRFKDRKSI